MTADDWELIKRIFDGALSLKEEQWPEYIASVAGDREEIRETVLELLRNHQTCRSESVISHGRGTTPALPPGELVAGRFRIVRFIAGGGMGEVYEAFDEGLQVRLALKTLRAELAMNAEALTRFRREVILPRGISHSSVCRVYDFVEHRVPDANSPSRERLVPCLSMELLEGESLARFIARERPLSVARALPIIRQIAAGLSALHESGIIHRDLKPANIMLVPRSEGGVRAVVMDFGLAKIESSDNDIFETRNAIPAGAPYFMAPEILRNERPSVASDIYAFGLLIDEMVTRERAFPGESLQSLYFSRLWEDPISPRARAEGLPERWEATILRCLAREPSARFGRTQDVLAALDGNFTAPGQPVRSRRYLTRRRVLAASVAAPVAFCAGFVAVALQPVQTSIDVFRIENLTGSPGWDYLAEGTTNELVRQLMQIGGLRVLQTRTAHSASHRKPKGRFSLDGVLRSEGEQIRLDVRIVDNRESSLVWSESFLRKQIDDHLQLQAEIAHGTALAIENRILLAGTAVAPGRGWIAPLSLQFRKRFHAQTGAALPGPPTWSNTAFDLYMRGHQFLESQSHDGIRKAIGYFKQAVREDRAFALAYAALADAHLELMNYEFVRGAELSDAARGFAEEAARYDNGLAEAHMVLGATRQHVWDWEASEASYREALRLKPSLARARRWYAGLILQFRRFDEAIREANRAMDEDPYDRTAAANMGLYLYLAGRLVASERILRDSIARKDTAAARWNLTVTYALMGAANVRGQSSGWFGKALEQCRAATAIEKAASPASRSTNEDVTTALVYTMAGDVKAARPYLERAEASMQARALSPVLLARVYAARHENKRALELLWQGASWRDRRLLYVNISPVFANVRGEPRFRDLLQKMRLA